MGDRPFHTTTAADGAHSTTADALSRSLREDKHDDAAQSAEIIVNQCAPDLPRERVLTDDLKTSADAMQAQVYNDARVSAGALHPCGLLEHGCTDRQPIYPFSQSEFVDTVSAVAGTTTTVTTDGRAADALRVPTLPVVDAALTKGLDQLATQPKACQKKDSNVRYTISPEAMTAAMMVVDVILNADASCEKVWEEEVQQGLVAPQDPEAMDLHSALVKVCVASRKCALLRSALTLMKAAMDKESDGSQSSSPLCNWIGQKLVDMENTMHASLNICATRVRQFQLGTSRDDSQKKQVSQQLVTLLSLTIVSALTVS